MKLSYLVILSALTFVVSCANNHSFEKYTQQEVHLKERLITSYSLGYTMTVPFSWPPQTKEKENISTETFELFQPNNDIFSVISISKFKGQSNNLEEQISIYQREHNLPNDFEVIEMGKTNFLDVTSQFSHIKSKNEPPVGLEVITFILKAKEDSTFMSVMCFTQRDENLYNNMSELLHCAKTFQLN